MTSDRLSLPSIIWLASRWLRRTIVVFSQTDVVTDVERGQRRLKASLVICYEIVMYCIRLQIAD